MSRAAGRQVCGGQVCGQQRPDSQREAARTRAGSQEGRAARRSDMPCKPTAKLTPSQSAQLGSPLAVAQVAPELGSLHCRAGVRCACAAAWGKGQSSGPVRHGPRKHRRVAIPTQATMPAPLLGNRALLATNWTQPKVHIMPVSTFSGGGSCRRWETWPEWRSAALPVAYSSVRQLTGDRQAKAAPARQCPCRQSSKRWPSWDGTGSTAVLLHQSAWHTPCKTGRPSESRKALPLEPLRPRAARRPRIRARRFSWA